MTRKVVIGQGSLAHTFKVILNLLQENIKHSIESVVGDMRGICFFVLRKQHIARAFHLQNEDPDLCLSITGCPGLCVALRGLVIVSWISVRMQPTRIQ